MKFYLTPMDDLINLSLLRIIWVNTNDMCIMGTFSDPSDGFVIQDDFLEMQDLEDAFHNLAKELIELN